MGGPCWCGPSPPFSKWAGHPWLLVRCAAHYSWNGRGQIEMPCTLNMQVQHGAYTDASFSRFGLLLRQTGKTAMSPFPQPKTHGSPPRRVRPKPAPFGPAASRIIGSCGREAGSAVAHVAGGSGTMELIYIMARCVPASTAAISCPVDQGEAARLHAHAGAPRNPSARTCRSGSEKKEPAQCLVPDWFTRPAPSPYGDSR